MGWTKYVNWLSKRITSLKSSLVFMSVLRLALYLNIFAMRGSNFSFSFANWNPLLPTLRSANLKWEASSSSLELDRSYSSSFSCCVSLFYVVNVFSFFASFAKFSTLISLRALVIFVFVSFGIGTVRRWVALFYTLVSLLVLPVIFT